MIKSMRALRKSHLTVPVEQKLTFSSQKTYDTNNLYYLKLFNEEHMCLGRLEQA